MDSSVRVSRRVSQSYVDQHLVYIHTHIEPLATRYKRNASRSFTERLASVAVRFLSHIGARLHFQLRQIGAARRRIGSPTWLLTRIKKFSIYTIVARH